MQRVCVWLKHTFKLNWLFVACSCFDCEAVGRIVLNICLISWDLSPWNPTFPSTLHMYTYSKQPILYYLQPDRSRSGYYRHQTPGLVTENSSAGNGSHNMFRVGGKESIFYEKMENVCYGTWGLRKYIIVKERNVSTHSGDISLMNKRNICTIPLRSLKTWVRFVFLVVKSSFIQSSGIV